MITLQGLLVDVDGRPAPGELVHLVANCRVWDAHPDTRVRNGREWVYLASARSDASGRYVVSAEVEAMQTSWFQLVVTPKDFAMTAAAVCLSKEMRPIKLTPPCRIEGTIRSPSGQPIRGANVQLKSVEAMFHGCWQLDTRQASHDHGQPFQAPYWPISATTDEDGKFTSSCIPQGAVVTLEVRAEGYATQSFQVVTELARDHFARLCKQRPQHSCDQCFPPQFTYVLEPPLIMEGRVFDRSTGEPIPDIEIVVSGSKRECGANSPTYVRSGADGTYRAAVRACDSYVIRAFAPLGYFQYRQSLMGSEFAAQIASGSAIKLDFPLGRGTIIHGRVVGDETGQPIIGASVVYVRRKESRPKKSHDDPEHARILTDNNGEYRITAQHGPGAILVEAPPDGYVRHSWNHRDYRTNEDSPHGVAEIDVPSSGGDVGRVPDITLRRGIPLQLRVVGAFGRPVKRGQVACPELRESLYARWDWIHAFVGGCIEFKGAEPGKSYRVLICAAGGRRGLVADIVAPRDSHPVTVHLRPTATIRGRLVHANGRPAAGVQLLPKFWTNLRKMLDPSYEPAVVQEADFYLNVEQNSGHCETRTNGSFKIRGIVAELPLILCISKKLASGLHVHPIGMLKPHENHNLGDLVLAD